MFGTDLGNKRPSILLFSMDLWFAKSFWPTESSTFKAHFYSTKILPGKMQTWSVNSEILVSWQPKGTPPMPPLLTIGFP